MARARTVALVSAGVLLLASSSSIATDEYGVTFESNVPVKMRDGVTLRADIYRPTADGKFPVLLQRTPYNKDGDVGFGPEGRGTRLRRHHSGRARPLHLRGRVVHLQARVRTTATTRWSGRRRCRIPMARSACSVAPTWAPRRCSPRSPIRRTWPASARS